MSTRSDNTLRQSAWAPVAYSARRSDFSLDSPSCGSPSPHEAQTSGTTHRSPRSLRAPTRRPPVRTTFSNTPSTKEREVSSPHYMIRPHRRHGLTEYPTNDESDLATPTDKAEELTMWESVYGRTPHCPEDDLSSRYMETMFCGIVESDDTDFDC